MFDGIGNELYGSWGHTFNILFHFLTLIDTLRRGRSCAIRRGTGLEGTLLRYCRHAPANCSLTVFIAIVCYFDAVVENML